MPRLTIHDMVIVVLAAVINGLHRANRIGIIDVDRLRARICQALVRIRLQTILRPYRLLGLGIPHRRRRQVWVAHRPVTLNQPAPAPAPTPAPTAYPAQATYPPGYCPDHGWRCPPDEAGPSRAVPARAASSRLPTRPRRTKPRRAGGLTCPPPGRHGLEYEELFLDGSNYPTWVSDIKIAFLSRGILSTISEPVENGSAITEQIRYTGLMLLRSSIHMDLKKEYLLEENPRTLWVSLKERYEQQKELILPEAEHDWNHLRMQDFKSIDEYNHAVHNICTMLKFCKKEPTDAEKIHKALSTMHPADRVLCNKYHKERHTVYSQLIHSLTQGERNDELLLKNHHLRPVGSAPLPEVHNVQNNAQNKRKHGGPPPGNPHNSSGGRRKNRNFIKNRRHKANKRARKNAPPTRDNGRLSHKCGCNTHFVATCRTPKHLVDLYLKSIRDAKQRENKYEAHFNQATEKTGGSSSVPKESPNNKTPSQAMDLPPTDNMLIEYNSNDMFGDLS
ncbi:hypothetical protein BS78_01G091600 [Paspalum vaginatum]|nr:hypothetical protein BS78_01G091600 [Paspalum vaginatum]